ncbi:MAG: nitrite reductase small subunit NirD [Alphaproteobacteria bacterium]|nr:nitrite reductase small subunit NirD [Alphaproteobacteria bacterium]
MAEDRWIEVGCLDDIPCRGARKVRMPDGDTVAVFRTADDEIFALIDRCPHKSGPLSEGIVQGRAVACPLHGWVIDLASGEAEAPDVGCTRSVPVRRAGDRIQLAVISAEPAGSLHWEAA